jgi:hypothetical protein
MACILCSKGTSGRRWYPLRTSWARGSCGILTTVNVTFEGLGSIGQQQLHQGNAAQA